MSGFGDFMRFSGTICFPKTRALCIKHFLGIREAAGAFLSWKRNWVTYLISEQYDQRGGNIDSVKVSKLAQSDQITLVLLTEGVFSSFFFVLEVPVLTNSATLEVTLDFFGVTSFDSCTGLPLKLCCCSFLGP